MSLRFEFFGGEDEMLRYNCKLVQHAVVRGPEVCDFQSGKGVLEGIKGLLGLGEVLGGRFGLVG
jgi:hypothetical protein